MGDNSEVEGQGLTDREGQLDCQALEALSVRAPCEAWLRGAGQRSARAEVVGDEAELWVEPGDEGL